MTSKEHTTLKAELSLLVQNPITFYNEVISRSDPRVKDWLLMHSPLPTLTIIFLYLMMVRYGPRLMKNRAPFEMKPVLLVFNTGVVAFYAYLVKEYIVGMLQANYNLLCQPADYSTSPAEMRIASALWWYYFSKCVEFLDTLFFILRKKDNQVTFLHVYHHSSMFFLWWIGVKWAAGGLSVMGALLNSGVHVIMYSYYALSSLGPQVQKYLWWKRHITHIQLALPEFSILQATESWVEPGNKLQFSLCIIHAAYALYIDCNFPKWMQYTLIGYSISFIVLFTNFYIHAYIKKGRARAKKLAREREGTSSQGAKVEEKEANGNIPTLKYSENGFPLHLHETESKKDQ